MCKFIAIINSKPANHKTTKTLASLVQANVPSLQKEQSGYSVQRNKTPYFFLGVPAYDRIAQNVAYKGEAFYAVHTRTATGGDRGLDGLHLQKLQGRYTFMHNGIVSGLSQTTRYSDSYLFFNRLIAQELQDGRELSPVALSHAIRRYTFSGKGMLYDLEQDIVYFFATYGLSVYALDGALVITSYDLVTEYTPVRIRSVLGYTWEEEGTPAKIGGILNEEIVLDEMLTFQGGKMIYRDDLQTFTTYGEHYSDPDDINQMSIKDTVDKVAKKVEVQRAN